MADYNELKWGSQLKYMIFAGLIALLSIHLCLQHLLPLQFTLQFILLYIMVARITAVEDSKELDVQGCPIFILVAKNMI